MWCPKCRRNKDNYKDGLCVFCYEESNSNDNNLPRTIDMQLVRELRMRGKRDEARLLLSAMHELIQKDKKTELKLYNQKISKIRKVKGLCSTQNCKNKSEKGFSRCAKCLEYQRKRYVKKKPLF